MALPPGPWVLGVSASHNGAACLMKGQEVVAAVQEERLVRVKRYRVYGGFPFLALGYCLEAGGIRAADLDLVVYAAQGHATAPEHDVTLNPVLQTGLNGTPTRFVSHHLAHAVSAFATSGFADAAVLVADGMGSPSEDLSPAERAAVTPAGAAGWESVSLYAASGTAVRPLEKYLVAGGEWLSPWPPGMPRFGTLGGMYSAVAQQIFGDHMDAGKVMGLAAYGRPAIPPSAFLDYAPGRLTFRDDVPGRYREAARWPDRRGEYEDLARSVQCALEGAVLALADRLWRVCPSANLCYAGGVALNGLANERLVRESRFKAVHVVPAAEDSGAALGAAYWGVWELTGVNAGRRWTQDAVGRPYPPPEDVPPGVRVDRPPDVVAEAVVRLCRGELVGWVQGRSELGPRALGQRSILADPRCPRVKERLDRRVKHREEFRPYAPAVLLEEAGAWFDLDGTGPESPFMLRVCRVRAGVRARIPAVVHVDGTARIQTVTPANGPFHDVVRGFFERTGVPLLLNTSFNRAGEPIVETPDDALWGLALGGLDCCVLGDRLATRDGPPDVLDLVPVVAAEECSLLLPSNGLGAGGPFAGATGASFVVTTRWGRTQQWVAPEYLPLIARVDGSRTGRALLAACRADCPGLAEEWLVGALALLRRLGVVRLVRAGPGRHGTAARGTSGGPPIPARA